MNIRCKTVYKTLLAVWLVSGFNPPSVSGQDTSTTVVVDSLIRELMNDNEDPAKVNVYTALSVEFLNVDHSRSLKYSQLGLELAEKIDYEKGVLESQMALAALNMNYLLDYAAAERYFKSALIHAQTLQDREAELIILKGLGNLYNSIGDFERARSYHETAMEIARGMDGYAYVSDLNAYMGAMYEQSGDTAKAIGYYEDVLALEKQHDFSETPGNSMIAVARYYLLTGDNEQALKYYRIALRHFERLNDFRWESYTHSEMALLQVVIGDLKRAEQHALRGLEIAENNRLKKELGDNFLALERVYQEMDSSAKSMKYRNSYDSLQASLKPVEKTAVNSMEVLEEVQAEVESDEINRYVLALLLLLPVVALILFMGWPSRSKS